jgi:hypothetical protein
MKKIVLAAVSALALSVAYGPAMASGMGGMTGAHANSGLAANDGSTLLNSSSMSNLNVVSSNTLGAHFGHTKITFAAAAAAGNGGNGGSGGVLAMGNGGSGGNGGTGAAAAGSLTNGDISQNSYAFQNFAGINTMTQSSASYNNNEAATSVSAYSPIGFGTGSATVN